MATSPSEHHLGYYQMLVTWLGAIQEDKMQEELEAIQESVAVLITSIINYITKLLKASAGLSQLCSTFFLQTIFMSCCLVGFWVLISPTPNSYRFKLACSMSPR